MSKHPKVTAHQVTRALDSIGYHLTRKGANHAIYMNQEGKRVTVPARPGKILHSKVLESVLQDAELSQKEFLEILQPPE